MGRPSKARALEVWMNGEHVGRWTLARGEHRFAYAGAWLQSPSARPLSLSMPLRPEGSAYSTAVVEPFFDNLLPDSVDLRRRIMSRFGIASAEPFDLLEEIGRDCVGAVQLLPPDAEPPDVHRVQSHALTERGVAELLGRLHAPTMGAQDPDDFRISLAGAQEKTALLWRDRRWHVPEGTTPTSHIFKLPMTAARHGGIDMKTSVENEWLCSELLPLLGIACARTEMRQFGDQRVLVVERFDRAPSSDGTWIMRLPQEDFCQVIGTPPSRKYEDRGGPGMRPILDWLLASSRALEDRADFFRTQFVFWLLCAIDGHAKNFSVFIEAGGRFHLTPRYDVLSAYPILGAGQHQLSPHKVKMAMAVAGKNRHYRWKEIRIEHWLETGKACGLPSGGRPLLEEVVERVPKALTKLRTHLPADFPKAVSEPILAGVQAASDRAARALR